MPQNQATVLCPPNQWTQLTNSDVTEITFQVQTSSVYIRFTSDTTTPTETRGLEYRDGEGELQKLMTDLTSLSGADRVWARPVGGRRAVVVVDTN
jgi:hypothetical protein